MRNTQANNLHERTSPQYLTCLQDPKLDTKMSKPVKDLRSLRMNDTARCVVGCVP